MTATYSYWLVFVSIAVAIFASYTALDLVLTASERPAVFRAAMHEVLAHIESGRLPLLPRTVVPLPEALDGFKQPGAWVWRPSGGWQKTARDGSSSVGVGTWHPRPPTSYAPPRSPGARWRW